MLSSLNRLKSSFIQHIFIECLSGARDTAVKNRIEHGSKKSLCSHGAGILLGEIGNTSVVRHAVRQGKPDKRQEGLGLLF